MFDCYNPCNPWIFVFCCLCVCVLFSVFKCPNYKWLINFRFIVERLCNMYKQISFLSPRSVCLPLCFYPSIFLPPPLSLSVCVSWPFSLLLSFMPSNKIAIDAKNSISIWLLVVGLSMTTSRWIKIKTTTLYILSWLSNCLATFLNVSQLSSHAHYIS